MAVYWVHVRSRLNVWQNLVCINTSTRKNNGKQNKYKEVIIRIIVLIPQGFFYVAWYWNLRFMISKY